MSRIERFGKSAFWVLGAGHGGFQVVIADAAVCAAVDEPSKLSNIALLEQWIREHRIRRLGFSYRLDPRDGAETFRRLLHQIRSRRLLSEQGGPLFAPRVTRLP